MLAMAGLLYRPALPARKRCGSAAGLRGSLALASGRPMLYDPRMPSTLPADIATPQRDAAHAHAAHHARPDLAQAAEARLRSAGEQWTPLRAQVFSVLAAYDRPASAYDITDRVSGAVGRRIAPNSVYRILDLFVANNLAARVESANAFIANAHPDCAHDCIFLVCDRCGCTTHVDDDHVADQMRAISRMRGFTPVRPVLEVRGLCGACA
jgi:Fur family zinc uptake transcriptional regulator